MKSRNIIAGGAKTVKRRRLVASENDDPTGQVVAGEHVKCHGHQGRGVGRRTAGRLLGHCRLLVGRRSRLNGALTDVAVRMSRDRSRSRCTGMSGVARRDDSGDW